MRRQAKVLTAVLGLAISVLLGAASALADTAPTVVVDAPSSIAYTSAHLSGTVDPNGGPSEANWHFEYSTDDASWSQAGDGGSAGSGSGPVNVSAELTGLSASSEYYVRLVATNDGGETISATPDPSFSTPPYPAPEATIEPVDLSALSAHFSGSVDPKGIKADYSFELAVDDGSPNWEAFGKGSSESASPITVEAGRDLEASTKYLARVSVTSNGGTVTSSEEAFATTTQPPTARAIAGSGRTISAVRLNGTVNPNGLPTTYRFEYGTSAAYGNVIPATGPDLFGGQGKTPVLYSKPISGFAPSTTIHYRLIAHNAEGTSVSADQTVTTLAEEVGYEMVSPPNKEGANLSFCCGAQASPSGELARYQSPGAFAGASGNLQLNPYLSRRGTDNWSTQYLSLPQTSINGGFVNGATQGLSPDLSHAFQFTRQALLPGAVFGKSNMYLSDFSSGGLQLIGAFPSEFGSGISDAGIFLGSSANGDHMVFKSAETLTPDAVEGGVEGAEGWGNIYDVSGGEVKLVNYLPNGTATIAEPLVGAKDRLRTNMVSSDGSRIFFVAKSSGGLYVRSGGETTLISASHRVGDDPTMPESINASWASADGSTIYFVVSGGAGYGKPLTEDAPPFEGTETRQLYRYDVAGGALTYIAPTGGPADTNFVREILGVSDDGSTVYFAAGHTDGESSTLFYPSNRIYLAREGTSRFIAETDPELQEQVDFAYASPNGRYLAIPSNDPGLTTPAANSCVGCTQTYLYDRVTDTLDCASCNPAGGPTPASVLPIAPEENTGGYVNRAVLDDGTVLFESPAALVPEDTNGKVDIYRWAHGQLDLVSTGHGKEDSHYGDVTPDGRSVFFYTGERLVTQDVDDAKDLYVARVGGGMSGQNPPLSEAPCHGEGCLEASPPRPGEVAPASNGFRGPVNPKSAGRKARCGKGKQRKQTRGKARCVKRTTKSKRTANKNEEARR